VCDKIDWMENGWMDWIEWMWKVDGKWMWRGSGSHICNVYTGKMIIKAAKRIFNSGEICHSYSDLNFDVTFFGTQCICMR